MAHRGRSEGFTLIELMIVVGIVSVLASAAIPVFQRYVRRARNLEGLHNIEKLADSAVAYHEAHSRLPALTDGSFWADWVEAPSWALHGVAYCKSLVWPPAASADFDKAPANRIWNALQFKPEGNIRFAYYIDNFGQMVPPWISSTLIVYRYEYANCQSQGGYWGMYYETRLQLGSDRLLHPLGPRERRF